MSLNVKKSISHHAHLVIGGEHHRRAIIAVLENEHGISVRANPDFFDFSRHSIGIDDTRELKSMHAIRPVSQSGMKFFVITTSSITLEAQNALLKLLEEPAEYARFFLVVPSEHILLPTLRSRLAIWRSDLQIPTDTTEAERFLDAPLAKRLEMAKAIADDISKEKRTRQDAIDFLNNVERVVYDTKGVESSRFSLEAIETARKYMHDRAPSVKMLLEYVAMNIS